MTMFLLRRSLVLVITLLVVSVMAFLIPYAGEGDTARKIVRARVNDPALDDAQVEALTRALGLDRPIYIQYFDWLKQAVTGDFGFSYTSRIPVGDLIVPSLSEASAVMVTDVPETRLAPFVGDVMVTAGFVFKRVTLTSLKAAVVIAPSSCDVAHNPMYTFGPIAITPVPITVQAIPSDEYDEVNVSPDRSTFSHCGAVWPASVV
jgi:uncharacterized membrane protein YfbV (UPF0208 family)